MRCPECEQILINPRQCDSPNCNWRAGRKAAKPLPDPLRCLQCNSTEVYKKLSTGWLCYDHTDKWHRDFTHNMMDYKLEHKGCDNREAWLYAMQFEPEAERLNADYYDQHRGGKRFSYNERELLNQLPKAG